MANRIQLRRGTAAEWTAANPVLGDGEPGVEKDTGKQKFGNGTSAWVDLPYASAGPQGPAGVADDESVEALVASPTSATRTALNATIASITGAVFRPTQAEAEAAAAQYGVVGYWFVEGSLTSVTAAAPTFNDGTDTYTIPTSTGVDYKVAGVTKAAGSYAVSAPSTVTVDAVAKAGYALTGTTQWTGTFTTSSDTTAPTAPTNLAGTAGSTTMALTWTTSTDAVGVTGYRVSKDNGATWITSAVTATNYTVTGLTASTSYTFAVAARDAAGNWSTNATLTTSTTAAGIPSGAYDDAVLADAPFYYLPLDDASGSTTARQIGSDAGATWAATSVTFGAAGLGDGATAASYDGTASTIVGPAGGLNNAAAWSSEIIIKPNTVSGNKDLLGASVLNWHMIMTNAKIQIGRGNTAGNNVVSATNLTAGTRYHVAAVYNGTDLRLYINGALDNTLAMTGALASSGTTVKIGDNGQGKYAGGVAGAAVYKTALSAARVLAHAQAAGLA